MRKLRVLSLFSGIGGFELGFERTGGFETVSQCELKPHARAVLAKNFPGIRCHDDVTTYEFRKGEADVITAGFPCQDLSFAGDGAGLAGARSGLYREVVRAVRLVRPLYAVLENVAALLSRGLGAVLGDLAEIGYDAEWHCIPASAVGAPHRRDRIWIIADAGGEQHKSHRAPLSGPLSAELSKAYMANAPRERCAQEGQLRHEQSEEWFARSGETMADASGLNAQRIVDQEPHQEVGQGSFGRPVGPCGDGHGWWAVEPGLGRVAHGVPNSLDEADGQDIQEHNSETGAKGHQQCDDLPIMRRRRATGAPSSGLLQARHSRGSLLAMPREGRPKGRDASREEDEELHDLRDRVYADTQQKAYDLQQGVPARGWASECNETLGQWGVEPTIPRVAKGVEHRVDRLEELGNAIVPQIPEAIGRAILESMRPAA